MKTWTIIIYSICFLCILGNIWVFNTLNPLFLIIAFYGTYMICGGLFVTHLILSLGTTHRFSKKSILLGFLIVLTGIAPNILPEVF